MRIPTNVTTGYRPLRKAYSLAGAALALTLTACDGDTLEGIQGDLEDGIEVNVSTNDDGNVVVSLIEDDDNTADDDNAADDDNTAAPTPVATSEPGSFQVTFTNLTQGQPMTPPVVALHDPSVHLFQVGEVSSDAIQVIAEMGNNAPLVEFAVANPSVVSAAGVAGDAPFGPGGQVTLNLTTTEEGQVFSAVNMLICTNDGISGVDSIALPAGTDPVVVLARPYDAGTRINQNNSYSFFPPPCRTNAEGALIDVAEAPLESPRQAIGAHAGQLNIANTPLGSNWNFATTDDVLMIEIVRTDSAVADGGDSTPEAPATTSVTVSLTNTSDSQPMTPPVVVLHNAPDADNGVRLFEGGQPASDPIIAIAENGNNTPLVELLESLEGGPVSTFALGFADPSAPGPLLPGNTATVDLNLESEDQVMSIVSMVVCTNDGFSGADSHTLSADASETFTLPIYDAGSETNVLTLNYWVPPCSPDGASENITDDENGSITLHPGQSGSENPVFDFEAGTGLLEVTITRN